MFAVRPCRDSDLDRVRAINVACLSENYPKKFWKEQFATGCPHFVAYRTSNGADSRAIVGYIAAMPCDESPVQIYSFAVRPECRRRGVAAMLLDAMVSAVAALALWPSISLNVRCDNAAALALYGKTGFVETRRIPQYYSDGCDGLLFKKNF